MTSPYVRPDLDALAELERLLGHLSAELASWRRRCQKAENELQGLRTQGGMVQGDDAVRLRSRTLDLEQENLELHHRVDRARDLLAKLQQRLAFLEAEDETAEAKR